MVQSQSNGGYKAAGENLFQQLNPPFYKNVPTFGTGGPGGGDGEMLEARVAKLEAHTEHIQNDVTELKTEIRHLRNFGAGAFVLTWSGIITAYLLLMGNVKTEIKELSTQSKNQFSEAKIQFSEANQQYIRINSALSDINQALANIDKRLTIVETQNLKKSKTE